MFWGTILLPALVVLSGYLISENTIFLYAGALVFIVFLIYSVFRNNHRCPICHKYIISWNLKCTSCEKISEVFEKKMALKEKESRVRIF